MSPIASLTQHLVLPDSRQVALELFGLGWGLGCSQEGGRKPCILPSARTRPGGWLVTPFSSRVPRTEAPLPHLGAPARLQAALAQLICVITVCWCNDLAGT